MEPKELQKLIDFIANSGLEEVNIETEQFKISTKRSSAVQTRVEQVYAAAPQQQIQQAAPAVQAAAPVAAAAPAAAAPVESNLITIKSPMIGTFYSSANPESDDFVTVGSDIAKGTPVCIIEAMKLFNEIESDISGRIVKILVANATPVEFDQPLFLVEPV
jgi:acetyl-CoA carboxylase biotin carboxyl carrier protein